MRSGRWFLIRSYSRRPCFGGLGLSVGGSFAALGLVVGGFLQAALVFFGPVPAFLGSGKVMLEGNSFRREYGGTAPAAVIAPPINGLSPRLRGNPFQACYRCA